MKISTKLICVLTGIFVLMACTQSADNQSMENQMGPVKVEIIKEESGYQLFRGGKPYKINGAGASGHLESLRAHGGNSFRTWSVSNRHETGKEVLDKALANEMTVTMCIYVQPERHGMNYDSAEQVAAQFERIKKEVLEHKDHPALLMWCIGNEVNLNYTNPKVFDAVNEISKWIHEVDPYHPTTTALASINPSLVGEINQRAPDLDILCVQVYGALFHLQDMLDESGWDKPYMITEWGAKGHWEVETTAWDAPIEQNSSQKADNYLKGYQKSIGPYSDKCLGSYVFLWGQKQERTPTWYGMFLKSGEETEAIDAMHYIWNGEWPDNRTPRIQAMTLDGQVASDNIYLNSEEVYSAQVNLEELDGDTLAFKWEVMHESTDLKVGGDYEETPGVVSDAIVSGGNSADVKIKAPAQEGAYRLFMYAFDGKGHAAHANVPFYVTKQ